MKGAVAAGHELTAETAREVLRAGGNAYDAAVAAFFTMCVCEPVLASMAGGGHLLARDRGGQLRLFDFFAQTPGLKLPSDAIEFYPVTVDFGSTQQEFHIGLGAAATPGAVSGMFSVNRALGTMEMRELVQPALELARNGVLITDFQAYLLQVVSAMYLTDSVLPLFCSAADPGLLASGGERFCNPELADVLEVLALEGRDFFYRGEIAARIQDQCEGRGHLSYQDMARYETISRKPLTLDYRGRVFYTNPPPSAGGVLIGFGLALLQQFDISNHTSNEYRNMHILAEVLRATSAARLKHFSEGPNTDILDPELLSIYEQQVLTATASSQGTTHASIVDGAGNIATMTISNGEGCGELVPGTGIVMNNMLGEADLNPNGFHQWKPDQRMSSMMAPSILVDNNRGLTALGSGGSNRIRSAILQVVSNLVDFGLELDAAILKPRLHIESEELNLELGTDRRRWDELIATYPAHRLFEKENLFFGGVHAVSIGADGTMRSVGDTRRSGVGLVL